MEGGAGTSLYVAKRRQSEVLGGRRGRMFQAEGKLGAKAQHG